MEALLLCSIIFAPLAFAAVEPWAFGLLYAVFFGLAARLYIKGLADAPNPLYKNLLPAVLGVALIGLLQAVTERPVNAPSAVLFTVWRPATLNAVVTWLFYAAVLYTVPQLIRTPAQFKRLMWTIFGAALLIALIGMLQKSGENYIIYGLRKVRGDSFGPFVNRDHGAMFLAMGGLAGLGLFFSGFRALAAHQSHSRFFDLLAVQFLKLVTLGAIVYGISRTGSRGGLHSFALSAIVIGFVSAGFLRVRKFKLAAYAGLALLLLGYGLFLAGNKRLLGLDGEKFDSSIQTRFSMYRGSLSLVKDFPAFGVGLGAVQDAFHPYKPSDMPAELLVRHVHSEWLELVMQAGFAGGLIYLAGLAAALLALLKRWRNSASFTMKALSGGAFAALLAAAAHSCVDFGLRMPANALLFYVLLGALASPAAQGTRELSDEYDLPEPRPAPAKYAAAITALAILLSAASLPQVLAWQARQQAREAAPELKLSLLAKALKWDPDSQSAFQLGAEHYNLALAAKEGACAKFAAGAAAIAPYSRRAPANHFLSGLNLKFRYQSHRCSRPRPNH